MVTTLYLVRHGETEGSGLNRYHGSMDIGLSEKGSIQVRKAAAFIGVLLSQSTFSRYGSYLKDVHKTVGESAEEISLLTDERDSKLSAVYCSDLGRAVKSAEIIAEPYGLRSTVVPNLRERSFGVWEGMSFIEIREKYPDEFAVWAENPLKYSPVGGENTLKVRDRVIGALEEIVNRHRGENISIVAHGGVNRIILCHVLGAPLENIFRIEQDYAAVNVIEFWDKYPVVKLINGGANG